MSDGSLTKIMGWDGSEWQKLGLLFGYYDRYAVRVTNTNASAGTNYVDTNPVPSGYIYVIQSVRGVDANSAIDRIGLAAVKDTIYGPLIEKRSPIINESVIWTGQIVLKEGDIIRGSFYGCTAGDTLVLDVWGYKMKIS